MCTFPLQHPTVCYSFCLCVQTFSSLHHTSLISLPQPSWLRLAPPFAREEASKKLKKNIGASKKIPARGEKTGVRMSASKGQATSLFVYFQRVPKYKQVKSEKKIPKVPLSVVRQTWTPINDSFYGCKLILLRCRIKKRSCTFTAFFRHIIWMHRGLHRVVSVRGELKMQIGRTEKTFEKKSAYLGKGGLRKKSKWFKVFLRCLRRQAN